LHGRHLLGQPAYLPNISPISPCISPVSPLHLRHLLVQPAELPLEHVVAHLVRVVKGEGEGEGEGEG